MRDATDSITAGWGAAQAMSGPVLVIPYRADATETVVQNGQSVTRTNQVMRELTLAREVVENDQRRFADSAQALHLQRRRL